MGKVSIYLNFLAQAEEAFNFYKSVFGTEFSQPMMKIGDLPEDPNGPKFSEFDKNCIMHVALPILGGTELMGCDILESMGHQLIVGNTTTINLLLDSKEEAETLYNALSKNGRDLAPMRDEFWGYWGSCCDQFNIRWMFNVMNEMNN